MPLTTSAQLIYNDDCTLKQLTNLFMSANQPVAKKQNSYFINTITEDLKLRIDKEGLATLLNSMFYIMASCSRDTCIMISVDLFMDVVQLHMKDLSTFNSYALISKRQHLQQLAEKIGGHLTITSEHPRETTITFSFTNESTRPVSGHYQGTQNTNRFAYA